MNPAPCHPALSVPILVEADDREASGGVLDALREMPEVTVTVKRLSLGDYCVDGYCRFERKTLVDFAASIVDGRLFMQAERLANFEGPAAILLEGRASDLEGRQMRRESLQGAMITLSLIYQLPVLRSLDPAESARLMIYAAHQLRRHARGWISGKGRRPKNRRKRQLRVLQSLPGIGPERAELLLARLGSVQAVMDADSELLQTVDGIGETTAAAIRSVLQEQG